MNSDDFMAEFHRTTWQNPFNNRERVLFHAAAIALTTNGCRDDEVRINCVRSLNRGVGYGSLALDWLTKLADKHGVELTGTIEPCGKVRPRFNVNQLKAWYRRHGFTVVGRTLNRPVVGARGLGKLGRGACSSPNDALLSVGSL